MNTHDTPWHAASFDTFLADRLPRLIAQRIPLASYRAQRNSPTTYAVYLAIDTGTEQVHLNYDALPAPNEDGIFHVEGRSIVVVPKATGSSLEDSLIACVGEQLEAYCESRLGYAPDSLAWDTNLVRAWLPIERWISEFLIIQPTSELLRDTNWLAIHSHLRRIALAGSQPSITNAHFGWICPVEAPESQHGSTVVTFTNGVRIENGSLVRTTAYPEATLGVTAATIPFVEHTALPRLAVATNLMHTWMPPSDPEPPLVHTGGESDAAEMWCGRNLLTAFVSWGVDTFEDALLISASCARRFAHPHPIEAGDLLSNRHGSKGVVSRIVPDEEMPHLEDGTPVEIVFHATGLLSRLNLGQVREAVMGRIAHAEGQPVAVPPFGAPDEETIRERAVRAGLRADGMERLRLGKRGKPLQRLSTVGWVYWGRTTATAKAGLVLSEGQFQGEQAYRELRDAEAWENIQEHFNTCAAAHPDAHTLAHRLSVSPVQQNAPVSPGMLELQRRLDVAGIRAELMPTHPERLMFRLQPPTTGIKLASPVLHPWLRGWSLTGWYPSYQLTNVGAFAALPEYARLVQTNERMMELQGSDAPASLQQQALVDLHAAVDTFFAALLSPAHLRFNAHVLFSGRAVVVPSADLQIDQVAIPEAMAWNLFEPIVAQTLGDANAAHQRTAEAAQVLDTIMSRSWVLLYHGGDIDPLFDAVEIPFLAFHPVRSSGRTVGVHPLICTSMEIDFDGDQVDVFLPVTQAAQNEAGAKLSLERSLKRNRGLLRRLIPRQSALLGLADLSRTVEGRRTIDELSGTHVATPAGFVDKNTIADALQQVYDGHGFTEFVNVADRLMRLGFDASRESGASISPFLGASFTRIAQPESDDLATWQTYVGENMDRFHSYNNYEDDDLGIQLLSIKSGARGNGQLLLMYLCAVGMLAAHSQSRPALVRHGYRDGLTAKELFAVAVAYHMASIEQEQEYMNADVVPVSTSEGARILARARRSSSPGIIFARAAAMMDEDPLMNVETRLFVGLAAMEQD